MGVTLASQGKVRCDLLITGASSVITCRAARGEGGRPLPRLGQDLREVGEIPGGAVAVAGEEIAAVGPPDEVLGAIDESSSPEVVDARGGIVMPGFVDSHTHLVFAGSRHREYVRRLQGAKYMEIMAEGGGINATVRATRAATREELAEKALHHLDIMLFHGTTTVEAKSGYGLTLEDEIKQLEAVRDLAGRHPVELVPTFLGAHAVPPEYSGRAGEYVDLVVHEMIPSVAKKGLAEFCDVFCEPGVFSVEESRRILAAAREAGMGLKLHADEIEPIGGAELAAELRAVSADHLGRASRRGMEMMAGVGVVAVLLPATVFTLSLGKYADARTMIDLGVPVALATDFNPGTSPTESMQVVLGLACTQMRMLPREALAAATINAAFAIRRAGRIGSIEAGKQADIIVMDVESVDMLPFRFGVNLVSTVIKRGKIVLRKT